MKAKTTVLALIFVFAMAFLSGCSKSNSVFGSERTDAQVAGDVQTKISGDSALAGRQISINANKGVVTLAGTVNSDAEITSAINDATGVDGVKQVVSRIQVAQATVASAPEPVPQQAAAAPAPARPRAVHRPAPSTSASNNTRVRDYTEPAAGASTSTGSTYSSTAPTTPVTASTVPAAPPAPVKVTIPAGATLSVRTIERLGTDRSHANDPFHGTLNAEVYAGDQIAIPAGADVEGRVVDAKDAAHYTGASLLSLEITKVSYGGHSYTLTTEPWTKEGDKRGKNTAEKVGGGAAVGAILGGIFGGGKGAAIGAAAGAGAGGAANTVTKGQQVILPAETLVNFRLANQVTVMPESNSRPGRRPMEVSDPPQ
jgi:outer membrane lipoprotein SlyB